MKNYRIAVLGSTGVVGREMIRLIEAGGIPAELVPLGSARSAGSTIEFHGEPVTVREATGNSFFGADFVLGAAKNAVARLFAPAIAESGAVFIDNSSAFRLMDDVPLVVPEINGADAFSHHGIIANPNCSTIIALMAAAPLNRLSRIETMTACTYQAVSGAGQEGLTELMRQTADVAAGRSLESHVFPAQIACNVIPFIGAEQPNGYTDEEMKMQNEGRRILHSPELRVNCDGGDTPQEAADAIEAFPGCRVAHDISGRSYPTPVDVSGQDTVWVGRIREDLTDERGLTLWCCGDQILRGAALNAVKIMRLFM